MTIDVFIKKVFDRLYRYLWANRPYSSHFYCKEVERNIKEKNIWLLGIPRSLNLGDQAQVMCSERLFAQQYNDYHVFEFDSVQLMNDNCMLLDCIASAIQDKDIIFFQSGYNFTDMYPFEERMHRETVKRIRNNKIVFLPQTLSFKMPYEVNEFVQESLALYSNNPNLLLMCRDKKSLSIAKEALPAVKTMAFPDTVTSMIGRTYLPNLERHGVMLCVRHDEEGVFSESELIRLKRDLSTIGEVTMIDTSVKTPSQFFIRRNREKYVMEMLNTINKMKVVITDRYHGLIFSAVANTPVVLLKTIDHKITEGIKWFPADMSKHIRIATSFKEAVNLAKELSMEPPFNNDTYFYDNYYSKLKEIISNESGQIS